MVDNHHHGPHEGFGWVPPSPQDKVRTSVSAVHDSQMQLEQGHRPDAVVASEVGHPETDIYHMHRCRPIERRRLHHHSSSCGGSETPR